VRHERISKKANGRLSGPLRGLAAVMVLAGIGVTPGMAQTWDGSVSNLWGTAANWLPNIVPNASTASAIINSSLNNPVLVNGSFTVGDLTIGTGNSINVSLGQNLTVDGPSLANNGTLTVLGGSGSNTFLNIGGSVNLSGTGTLALSTASGGGTAYLQGDGQTLTNDSHIAGNGIIGNGNLIVNNEGTIRANVSGSILLLNGGGLTNTGTLQVNAGSTMMVRSPISSTTFNSGTLLTGTYILNGAGAGYAANLEMNLGNNTGGEITTNAATIILNGPQSNFVDIGGNNALSNLSNNTGTLDLLRGYTFDAPDTNFTDSGTMLVSSDSTFQIPVFVGQSTEYLQTAGITQVNGELATPVVNIEGGMLAGDGTIIGGVTGNTTYPASVTIQNGATIQAGDVMSDPPGTLDIVGTLDLSNGSTVDETISGTALADISLLTVTGNLPGLPGVNLGSSVGVDVMLLNGFDPSTCPAPAACQFTFLEYTGTLNRQSFFVTDPNVDPFGTFRIGYGTNDAYLSFTPNATPEPAAFLPLAGLLACVAYGIRRRKLIASSSPRPPGI
jgi:hypothetical protein